MKIELGCGGKLNEGFVGCDVNYHPGVQYVVNALDLIDYVEEESVDEFWSRHFFEHLSFDQGEALLRDCYAMLKPGGVFQLMVPDLLFHLSQLCNPYETSVFRKSITNLEHARNSIFGWQISDEYSSFHKSGYTFELLRDLLKKVGYVNIRRIPEKDWNLQVYAEKP